MVWNPPRKSISDLIPLLEARESFQAMGQLALPEEITFEWADLVLSLERTLTLTAPVDGLSQEERHEFATTLAEGAASRINLLVEKGSSELCFSNRVAVLADNLRTSLAGEVGAAITDLTMERLGFHWRANGRDVRFIVVDDGEETDKRLPDFVYDPGARAGFAVGSIAAVEAKGSLSKTGATRAAIRRLAKSAFKGQVAKYLGARASECVVAAGFAVAYGAVPGSSTSTLAIASSHQFQSAEHPQEAMPLSAAAAGELQPEPQHGSIGLGFEHEHCDAQIEFQQEERRRRAIISKAGGGGDVGGGGEGDGGGRRERGHPSRRVALANYEAVFQVCGAFAAARLMRALLSGRGIEGLGTDEQFEHFEYFDDAEEPILCGYQRRQRHMRFGIAATSAEEILRIAASPGEVPSSLELGIVPADRRRVRGADVDATLQGDGFALINDWRRSRDRTWDLRKGDWVD